MQYFTQLEVQNYVGEENLVNLTDDDDDGAVDAAVFNTIRKNVQEEIDGYCEGRYDVPFSQVPRLIKIIAIRLFIAELYKRRTLELPESVEQDLTNARRNLEMISKGQIALTASSSNKSSSSKIQYSNGQRRFSYERKTSS